MLNSQISHRTPRKKEKNIFNFFYFCLSRGRTLQYSLTNFLQDYTLILMTFHACLLSQQCLEQTSLQVKLLFSYHSTLACHSPVIKTVRRTLTYMFLHVPKILPPWSVLRLSKRCLLWKRAHVSGLSIKNTSRLYQPTSCLKLWTRYRTEKGAIFLYLVHLSGQVECPPLPTCRPSGVCHCLFVLTLLKSGVSFSNLSLHQQK